MKTLGIYIQVPFCASKCSFCNFSSRVERRSVFDAYVHALEREIVSLPAFYSGQGTGQELLEFPVDTLYVGGGTPSLLGPARLGRIVKALDRRFHLERSLEFTLEVTPGSADADFLEAATLLGINRLSIGAQTFDDHALRVVGRLHSAADTRDLVRLARRSGFSNLNLDLIAGLPYQTESSWLQTLDAAAKLRPEHVSLYLMEIDEKSRLGREIAAGRGRYHAAAVPSEESIADSYEVGRQFLAREGYTHYEISNFALEGYASRHNQKYWRLAPYVGLGAGAHSFDGEHRWANEPDVQAYQQKLAQGSSPITQMQSLSVEQQVEEFFFLGLRQRQGVNLALAGQRWGLDRLSRWQERIEALSANGWLEKAGATVRLPEHAYLVSNEIFQEFVVA